MAESSIRKGADFDELRSRLKKQIKRDGVAPEELSDVFQDALVVLHKEKSGWALDGSGTEERLRCIAHDQARNVRRRRQRHRPVSQDEQEFILDAAADPFVPDDEDADTPALLSPLTARIWEVVKGELGGIDRQIFTLFVAGLDYVEIAKRLGLTAHQVRDHYSRAVRKVRSRLGFPANPDCVDWWGGGGSARAPMIARINGRERRRLMSESSMGGCAIEKEFWKNS